MMYEATKCRKHEVVSIKIPLEGYPQPDITWSIQGNLVFNDSRHNIHTTPSFTTLTINDADRKDSGFFVVQAKNRFATDSVTVELLVVDVPQPPENVKVSEITRDSCQLTWGEPRDAGGLMLQKYSIEMCPASSNRWTQVSSTRSNQYTVINLSGRTRYQFRVLAINDIGPSKPSDPSETITTKEDRIMASNYDDWVDPLDRFQPYVANISTEGLTERYHICEEIGHGAFGVCHRVQEIATQKAYVAKFMKVDGADRVHVRREIDIMRKLQHPKILQLHEVCDLRNEIVMLTEFISGTHLFEKLADSRFDLNEQKCIGIVKQVSEALAFIHSMKIGHFDLKPTNIVFVTKRNNQLKLMDFGQSRILSPGETIRMAYKTPDFIAPEVVTNDVVSLATDIWSLGVLVYFMVTGKLPFAGENEEETRNNVIDGEFDFNIPEFGNISDDCLDFIERCLQKERKPRMSAIDAIQHPWLQPVHKELNRELIMQRQKPINTTPHREIYKKNKKTDMSDALVGIAKWATGGALRSHRGHTVSKVRTAPWDMAPKVRHMQHLMVKEGQTPKLLCRVENATGNEKITWYHNNIQIDTGFTVDSDGNEVKNNDKYEAEFTPEKGASLYIVGVKEIDQGSYRVRVENSFGYSISCCEVCVERRSDRTWTRTKRSLYMKHKVQKGVRGREVQALRRPPEFTLPLYNRNIIIGDSVEFAVTVTVHPDPVITWFKDGQKIVPNKEDLRYDFSSAKGLYSLKIRNAEEEMTGEYSVHAKNPYGEDTSKAMLTVMPVPEKQKVTVRPMFRRLLSNMEVEEGQHARFDIRVTGFPKPELKWEKDAVEITPTEHHQIVWESQHDCYLICYHTFGMDSGLYKVTATNSAGVASCQANLTVKPIKYERKIKLNENADLIAESKRAKLARIIAGDGTPVAMNESAKIALAEAEHQARQMAIEGVDSEPEDPVAGLGLSKVEVKEMKMPYKIPEAREHDKSGIDKSIEMFQPISDMKWYRSTKKAAEQIDPTLEGKRAEIKKPKHMKQLLIPDTGALIPQKRVKADLNLTSDKFRTLESIMTDKDKVDIRAAKEDPNQTWITYFRPELDDDLVLKPVGQYMDEVRAKDILNEEEIEREALRVKKFKNRKELRKEMFGESDEEFELTEVKVPKKKMYMGTPGSELEKRHKQLLPDRESKKRMKAMMEDDAGDDCMRNIKSGSFKYEGVADQLEAEARRAKKYGSGEGQAARARYVPTADEDQSFLDKLKPRTKAPRHPEYLINKKPLGEADFETHELLRPVGDQLGRRYDADYESDEDVGARRQRRIRRDSGSSIFTTPGRHGTFEEEVGDETLEFTSSKLKRSTKKSGSTFSEPDRTVPTIETPPAMQIRLNSHSVPAGMSTKFMCSVTGKPAPKITWFHNGDEVRPSSKYEIENLAGVVTLKIHNCSSADAGTYKMNASNSAGETSDYGKLEIGSEFAVGKNQRKVDDDAMGMSSMKMAQWSQREGYRASTEAAPMKKTHIAGEPYFLSAPRDQTVAEGETARFTANVDGRPTPRTTWSKMGSTLRDNEKYSMRSIRNQQTFEIRNVSVTDAGEYAVNIQSVNGEDVARFTLNVSRRASSALGQRVGSPTGSQSSRRSAKAPVVTSQLHASLKMDGTVQLECSVLDRASVQNVIWYCNDQRVTAYDSRRVQSADDDQFILTINDINEADAGHYACHMSGSREAATTSCDLSIEKVQGYINNIKTRLAKPVEVVAPKPAEPGLTIESLPSTLDIPVGRVLSLSTTYTGNPTSIQWSLNGAALSDGADGGRISIETTSSSSTITVLSVADTDAGMYKLKIESATACEFSTANVNVNQE